MRRETNNDRQQRLFVTGLLISAAVGALIGLLWPLWFPADSACETTIPDASFSVPTLAIGGTQLPGEEGAAMKICCLTFDDGPSKYTPQVLAALEKCDAKATFFVTAQDANQDYLSYLTDIEAAGHQIALHSASHSYSRILQQHRKLLAGYQSSARHAGELYRCGCDPLAAVPRRQHQHGQPPIRRTADHAAAQSPG